MEVGFSGVPGKWQFSCMEGDSAWNRGCHFLWVCHNPLVKRHHPRRCLNFLMTNSSFHWGLTIGMRGKYMVQDGVHASKSLYWWIHCLIYHSPLCFPPPLPHLPLSHFSLFQEPTRSVLPGARQVLVSLRIFCPHLGQFTYLLATSFPIQVLEMKDDVPGLFSTRVIGGMLFSTLSVKCRFYIYENKQEIEKHSPFIRMTGR